MLMSLVEPGDALVRFQGASPRYSRRQQVRVTIVRIAIQEATEQPLGFCKVTILVCLPRRLIFTSAGPALEKKHPTEANEDKNRTGQNRDGAAIEDRKSTR